MNTYVYISDIFPNKDIISVYFDEQFSYIDIVQIVAHDPISFGPKI